MISVVRLRNSIVRFLQSLLSLLLLCEAPSSVQADDNWKLAFDNKYENFRAEAREFAVFSPDGQVAAIGCGDKSIRLWDISTGKELRRLVGHGARPVCMAFSPDGKRLVSSAPEDYPRAALHVWSVATGEALFIDKAKLQSCIGVAWHPDGKSFVTSLSHIEFDGRSAGYSLDSWDAETFRQQRRIATVQGTTKSLMFSADGQKLLANTSGWPANLIDYRSGQLRQVPNTLHSIVMSPDGSRLAGTDKEGNIVILDSKSMTEVRRFLVPRNDEKIGRVFRTDGFGRAFFHPQGDSVFTFKSGFWSRWNLDTGELLQWQSGFGGQDSFIAVSPDGRLMLQGDGTTKVYLRRLADRRILARLHLFERDGHWATDTPDGYFHHSDGIAPQLTYEARREPGADFLTTHRRPVMVARLLDGMSVADAEKLPEDGQPPVIEVQLVETQQEAARVRIVARCTTAGGGIRTVSVRVDGREIRSPEAKGLRIESIRPEDSADAASSQPVTSDFPAEQISNVLVPFPPGRNTARIQAVAIDSYGQRSAIASVSATRPRSVPPVEGRLFVLAVGVSEYDNPSLNLRYCDDDADELAAQFMEQKGRAFGDVQIQVYTNRQATVTNVKEGLSWLQRSCTENDIAVVLFSGHGVQKERGLYYCTHETNVDGLQYTALNWESVGESLRDTRARQILFLSDACHAGAFGSTKLASQQALAGSLRDSAGVMFFASSSAEELSIEDPAWGHGAFCKAVLDGLAGASDSDENGKITIQELRDYVCREVPAMTGDRQHPQIPDLGNYDPDLVITAKP